MASGPSSTCSSGSSRARRTGLAADQSRIDFNIFLRFLTVFFSLFLVPTAAGLGASGIAAERSRETWSSLLATPLTARDILWAKTLAAFWRLRCDRRTMVIVLWTLGLIAGAIHPLGFVLSLLRPVLLDVVQSCLGDALRDQEQVSPSWPRFQA